MKKQIFFQFLAFSIATIGNCHNPSTKVFETQDYMPKSPTVAQMVSYVDRPVSLFSGSPSISIPLCEVDACGITLPLSLSYSYSGLVPSQEASWVGLGWNFSLGACVSRSIKCINDFYDSSGYYIYPGDIPFTDNSQTLIKSCFIEPAQSNPLSSVGICKDLERDIFYYSFWGGGSKFILDKNNKDKDGGCVMFDCSQGWKMSVHEGSKYITLDVMSPCERLHYFELHSPEGDRYIFDEKELTYIQNYNYTKREVTSESAYTSSWFLTSIITHNGDTVVFDYEEEYYKPVEHLSYQYNNYVSKMSNPGSEFAEDFQKFEEEQVCETRSAIQTKRLKSVKWKNGSIKLYTSEREDLRYGDFHKPVCHKLDSIVVFDGDNKPVHRFELCHSYFGQVTGKEPDYLVKRLRLDSVWDKNNPEMRYSLSYKEGVFPNKDNQGTDYWGFYNGKNYGSKPYCRVADVKTGEIYEGAAKYSDYEKTSIGALTSIKHPTGGEEMFKYELNKFRWLSNLDKSKIISLIDQTLTLNQFGEYTDVKTAETIIKVPRKVQMNVYSTFTYYKGSTSYSPLFTVYQGDRVVHRSEWSRQGPHVDYVILTEGEYRFVAENLPKDWIGVEYIHLTVNHERNFWDYYKEDTIRGAGLRIASIEGGGKKRTFEYPVGKLLINPILYYHKGFIWSGAHQRYYTVQVSESTIPLSTLTKGYMVGYHNVSEICGNQKTDYFYDLHTEDSYQYLFETNNNSSTANLLLDFYDETDPYLPTKNNFRNGLLLQTEVKGEKEKKVELYNYGEKLSPRIAAITCHGIPGALALHYQIEWLPLSQKKEFLIDQEGDSLCTTIDYEYNEDFLLKKQTVKNKVNERNSTEYKYASDFTDAISKKMVEANMVGIPVATLYSRNGTVYAGQRTEYGVWGDKILPSRVSALNTDQTSTDISKCKFDRVISYRNYDNYGNPQEVIYKGDTITYLWGYKGQYPIAEIKGMDFKSVNRLLSKNLSGLLSKTNLSAADFEPLRNYVQGKPIALTTCLYKPLVGVTQITAPTNQTQSFQYDKAGRLAKSYFGADELHNAYYYHYADQTDGRNYVLSTEYQDETASDSTYTIQYYDEWGRPSLSKTLGVNMHRVPVFGLQTYDKMGRPDKAWTPIPSGRELTPENFATNSASVFNGDTWGFAETSYDGLGRTIRTTVPGKAWHDKGAATTYTYLANSANTVKWYKVEGDKLVQDGYYPAQILSGTTTTDPDGLSVTVYKDVFDNVVLERRADDNDTYYVYDDYNRLRFVLQPMYQEEADLDKFAFQYKYNGKGLVTVKKLPGCQLDSLDYHPVSDRLIKMQDGLLRGKGKYRVYAYDGLGRLTKQSISNGKVVEYDEIENFYDNYRYLEEHKDLIPENNVDDANLDPNYPDKGQGQLTGVLQRASNGEPMLMSYTYDDHHRLIISKEIGLDKHLGVVAQFFQFNGTLQVSQEDFYRYDKSVGKLNDNSLYAWKKHLNCPKNNKLPQTTVIHLQYDPNQKQKSVMTHSYAYDEFGRIARSDRSGNAADMEYSYDNMHGWLTAIESHGGFKQTLYHENSDKNPRYNGSISGMAWEVGDDVRHSYSYTYDELNRLTAAHYTGVCGFSDRTKSDKKIETALSSLSKEPYQLIPLPRNGTYGESYSYDRNCNITSLQRVGLTNTNSAKEIDLLEMTYSGNQLKSVSDNSDETLTYAGAFDFQDKSEQGVEYSYNGNGAMTQDLNKGINDIEYDLLGHPKKVTFSDKNYIEYVYAADGRRLRAIHRRYVKVKASEWNGDDIHTKLANGYVYAFIGDTTDYVNTYVFKNSKPYMYQFQDGYYSFDKDGKLDGYHLYVKDYQGNVRMVVNGETDSIEQVNHYYPYGALIGDISTGQDFQKYKYSGKELNRQFGLDWYDFHARQQDPLLGRFNSIDPMAEKYYSISPYAYCAGDPINCIDPTGCVVVADSLAQEDLLNGFNETERQYIEFDENGNLLVDKLYESDSSSDAFAALKSLAESDVIYSFNTSEVDGYNIEFYFPITDEDGNTNYYYGVTHYPGAPVEPSKDGNVQIYTFSKLELEKRISNRFHEGLGHAYFYEKSRTDKSFDPAHRWEANSDGIFERSNKKLESWIAKMENYSINNYRRKK